MTGPGEETGQRVDFTASDSRAVRPLRVIFAGTPEFARVALERLHMAGHQIQLVLTQPDRPAGRGMKLQISAVKQFALAHGMNVSQPRSLRLDGKYPEDAAVAQHSILEAQAEVMVVAAYGLILPQWVLDAMQQGNTAIALARGKPDAPSPLHLGCLNIHASLLPRWRGAAPIHRAIEAGDRQTGISIMQMDAGLDTGAVLLSQSVPIRCDATTATLHDELAELGGQLVVDALDLAVQGRLEARAQPTEGVCYAHKIEKNEARVIWNQGADQIVRCIRAFNPYPVANTVLQGESIKIWSARVVDATELDAMKHRSTTLKMEGAPPGNQTTQTASPIARSGMFGEILALGPEGIAVAADNSAVLLTELQRAGGKRLPAAEFLRGFALQTGQFAS